MARREAGFVTQTISVPVGRCHQSVMRAWFALNEREDGMFGAWWESIATSTSDAHVDVARREEIEPLISRYEWLGNLPDNCSLYAKLTFGGNIGGAVAFSQSGFGGRFTFLGRRAWKLTRGVSVHWAPPWAASFLIRRSLRLLFDEPVIVVAFSDWDAGEVGTVYQASGWTYLGARKGLEWVSPNGDRRDAMFHKVRVVSGSQHRKTGRVASLDQYRNEQAAMLESGWSQVETMRGKYAIVAGRRGVAHRELVALLRAKAQPYPKRRGEGLNGGDASHSSEEGQVRFLIPAPTSKKVSA